MTMHNVCPKTINIILLLRLVMLNFIYIVFVFTCKRLVKISAHAVLMPLYSPGIR